MGIIKQLFLVVLMALLSACRPPLAESTPTIPSPVTVTPAATSTSTNTALPTEVQPTVTDTPPAAGSLRPTAIPSPTLGPYPGLIALTGMTANGAFIVIVNMANLDWITITGDDRLNVDPVWSSDGKHLAYLSIDPQSGVADLMRFDTDTGEIVLVRPGFYGNLMTFSWSADGQYAVFDSPQENGTEQDVYRVDMYSGQLTNLTVDSPVWDAFPAYSPDGTRIVFVSDRAPGGKASDNIWLMDSDAGGLVNLTPNDEYFWEDSHPAWSPDGSRIAFFRYGIFATDDTPGGPGGLWEVNVDGSGERLIFATGDALIARETTWSPDGKYIAYISSISDKAKIWLVDAEAGEAVVLVSLKGEISDICWSPDSRALAFSHHNGGLRLMIASADGSGRWPVFDFEGNGFADWSP